MTDTTRAPEAVEGHAVLDAIETRSARADAAATLALAYSDADHAQKLARTLVQSLESQLETARRAVQERTRESIAARKALTDAMEAGNV